MAKSLYKTSEKKVEPGLTSVVKGCDAGKLCVTLGSGKEGCFCSFSPACGIFCLFVRINLQIKNPSILRVNLQIWMQTKLPFTRMQKWLQALILWKKVHVCWHHTGYC